MLYSLGNSTANGLSAPAVSVVDIARLPENVGSNDPRPEELPEDTGPPGSTSVH